MHGKFEYGNKACANCTLLGLQAQKLQVSGITLFLKYPSLDKRLHSDLKSGQHNVSSY